MCVKLPLRDLNPYLCPPHSTSTYTCGVTTAPWVHNGTFSIMKHIWSQLQAIDMPCLTTMTTTVSIPKFWVQI